MLILPSNSYLLIINDMQVLLLFPLFPRCARRQVIVGAAAVVLQVVESQIRKICWLHVQILESLGSLVDDLIKRLLFQLIRRCDSPVEVFIEIVCERFCQSLWHIDMSALLHDFAVHHLSDFSHAIICWTVELKSLSGSCVIVADLFESFADIDGLQKLDNGQKGIPQSTHMDRIEPFSHTIHCEHICSRR